MGVDGELTAVSVAHQAGALDRPSLISKKMSP
jgi:hypothetical protein